MKINDWINFKVKDDKTKKKTKKKTALHKAEMFFYEHHAAIVQRKTGNLPFVPLLISKVCLLLVDLTSIHRHLLKRKTTSRLLLMKAKHK